MADDQVSLPYLIVLLVVVAFTTRYFFFSSPAQTRPRQPNSARQASLLRMREQTVQRIQQMFPQVDRRTILWDLQRNGGSIQVTSERILAGRLETPPITFQPPPPPEASGGAASASSTGATQAKQPEKPSQPDLITRYNLKDKLDSTSPSTAEGSSDKQKGWSTNKEERQSLLQRRRDEMILAARRKMEARLSEEKASGRAS